MNNFDGIFGQEAKIRYLQADYQIEKSGAFVVCAITKTRIPLDELKYWSVLRQEPYLDAAASLRAERQARVISV